MSIPSVQTMHLNAMKMMPGLLPQNQYSPPNMPYLFNPYMNAFNMSPIYSSMPNMNNVCMPQVSNVPVFMKNVDAPKSQPNPKIESIQSKEKSETERRTARTNKSGPKEIWVPKST